MPPDWAWDDEHMDVLALTRPHPGWCHTLAVGGRAIRGTHEEERNQRAQLMARINASNDLARANFHKLCRAIKQRTLPVTCPHCLEVKRLTGVGSTYRSV